MGGPGLTSLNTVWPKEVQTIVKQAFLDTPNTYTEFRYQKLCEQVNQRLLDKVTENDIIAELNKILARCERVEAA